MQNLVIEKDVLHGETCQLIAAEQESRGFHAEWKLTLCFETASFEIKAFAEHARLMKAAGLNLPERYHGKQDYSAPHSVVIENDVKHGNARRIVGAYTSDGKLLKIADYKYDSPRAEIIALRDENETLKTEIARLQEALKLIVEIAGR